jgi:hypothetical protein
MKKWIIKEGKKKEFIRLDRFGFFGRRNSIKLYRRYIIHDFKPVTLFRNTLQEIKVGNFWCKFLYRLNDNENLEFVIEDFINDNLEEFEVFSTYVSFVSSIEFKAEIYLDSRNELCRKYTINGTSLYPISTKINNVGKFYKILSPKLSKERTSDLIIEYENL